MSSLGDVVHALPALTDAAAHGFSFDWVVEEAFAAIPARHPAVHRVIPIAWRRWRKNLSVHGAALGQFRRSLRETSYPLVLDAQGLLKSAVVSRMVKAGYRVGFDSSSAREGCGQPFLWQTHRVARGQHAVDRLRQLFAAALDYPLGDSPPDFGLTDTGQNQTAKQTSSRECLLLHGTTWETKHWPEAMWIELARRLAADDWRISLPWGDALERAARGTHRSSRAGCCGARCAVTGGTHRANERRGTGGWRGFRSQPSGRRAGCACRRAVWQHGCGTHRRPRCPGEQSAGAFRLRTLPQQNVRVPGAPKCTAAVSGWCRPVMLGSRRTMSGHRFRSCSADRIACRSPSPSSSIFPTEAFSVT